MQKLCGCCEVGLYKEQKKTSGWKEEVRKRVVRAAGEEGSRGQTPKTLQAIAEGLGFIRNGTGRFSLKKRHGIIYISERSFCSHCKGFGLKQSKDEYRDGTAVI